MKQLSIEICNSRAEAVARKDTIKSANPDANWVSRIIDDVDFVMAFLVPDIKTDPTALPIVFSPDTAKPRAPGVVLLIWTEG